VSEEYKTAATILNDKHKFTYENNTEKRMLQGKAVVITGAGRGIGAACAQGVARQGASVVVNDVDLAEAERTVRAIVAKGGTAIACVADVSDWEQAGRLIETCITAFGKIDGLVNNAALYHIGRVDTLDPVIARALVEVNVLGPIHCTGQAVKPMLAQGSGSIVNVVSGAQMGMPGMGIYGATKGAVASMVYTWAMELAGTGVRVNALSPFGATDILGNSARQLSERYGVDPAAMGQPASSIRIQPPEANAPVVEYLLSDAANGVNGQLVRIDEGELQLYTHPALLMPSVRRDRWDATLVAQAFAEDLQSRQVRCGVMGMESLPVELTSGHWKRNEAAETS
jgi:NAD(P)-dependent dehydrogenase (short-subunit alcohol dehydrogenase family)